MKKQFTPTNNDLSYYPVLFKALESTSGDVVEMGTGHGSTSLLHDYCMRKQRRLYSYDEKEEWGSKFYNLRNNWHSVQVVSNWDVVFNRNEHASVIFIDHAPGERRKVDLEKFKNTKGIIIIHDSEPTGAGDYQVRPLFSLFKYKVEVKTSGAWATALSNEIDITKWDGEVFGDYKIEI